MAVHFDIVLGIIGNVISISVLASPIPTFWGIIRDKSAGSFSSFPYISTLFNNMLWLYYGALKSNGIMIVTSSGAGCVFEAAYIIIYLWFGTKAQRMVTARLLVLINIIFIVIFSLTIKFAHTTTRLNIVGMVCALNAICVYASPLVVMKRVIKTKSVEYMPLLLSLTLFVSASIWLTYGFLIHDLFLEVPNGIGLFLGAIQLILYAIYRNGDKNGDVAKLKTTQIKLANVQTFDSTPSTDIKVPIGPVAPVAPIVPIQNNDNLKHEVV